MKILIDVRTPAEFQAGNVPGSINIPLNEIPARIDEVRNFEGSIHVCCLSGGRSGQAVAYLNAQGISCTNAGSWMDHIS